MLLLFLLFLIENQDIALLLLIVMACLAFLLNFLYFHHSLICFQEIIFTFTTLFIDLNMVLLLIFLRFFSPTILMVV